MQLNINFSCMSGWIVKQLNSAIQRLGMWENLKLIYELLAATKESLEQNKVVN